MIDITPFLALPVVYIDNQKALAQCILALENAPTIAFDLEFDRDRYSYGFDLCLMQVADSNTCYLIDPQGELNIRDIFPLMQNPVIEKLVHCSGEDLRLLHSLQCFPTNLIDTEIYAKLLDFEFSSLSAVLMRLFGLELDKKMQKVNWGSRPLSDAQMEYAANDVRFLIPIKNALHELARENNRLELVREELAELNRTIFVLKPKENFLKASDAKYSSPFEQYVLNEMFRYRDELAKFYNKPAHFIMSESLLRDIVTEAPSAKNWSHGRGLHPALKTNAGINQWNQQLKFIRESAEAKNLDKNTNGRPHFSYEERIAYEAEKDRQQRLKAEVFEPIQREFVRQFGENTQRFLMSNSLVQSILTGQVEFKQLKPAYRQQLIVETGRKLGVDLSEIE